MTSPSGHLPLVTAILAVRNEGTSIRQVLQSILCQSRATYRLEILVVDGDSTDGTGSILRDIVSKNPDVTVLQNTRGLTPFAFNIGLNHARGEYVCILGAHTVYASDYIETCMQELQERSAAGCGGRVIVTAANDSLEARLVAAALGSSFGTSSKSFRNHKQGYAETINYPVYLRSALAEVGGYDEQLYRNQDNELNQRLRAKGHELYVSWKTSCRYLVQPTIAKLAKYAWKTGYWNVISVKKNPSAHGIYHFVPALFVSACMLALATAALGWRFSPQHQQWANLPFVLLMMVYFAAATLVSSRAALGQKWSGALLLPFIFVVLHVTYGLGTVWALLSNASSPEKQESFTGPPVTLGVPSSGDPT